MKTQIAILKGREPPCHLLKVLIVLKCLFYVFGSQHVSNRLSVLIGHFELDAGPVDLGHHDLVKQVCGQVLASFCLDVDEGPFDVFTASAEETVVVVAVRLCDFGKEYWVLEFAESGVFGL